MDKIDANIIRALQQNARLTNQELADQVGLSPSPCLRRVRILEEKGLIKGYTALVDEKAYGLPLTVFVRISLERHTEEIVQRFEERVRNIDDILECYITTGTSDYLLRVQIADMDHYERFVRQTMQTIPGIGSIDTSIAYSTVKNSPLYPTPPGI